MTGLNDGLEKVLSNSQKAQTARSLTSWVISKYQKPTELDVLAGQAEGSDEKRESGIIPRHHEALSATAKIKRLICLSRNGETLAIGSFELSKD